LEAYTISGTYTLPSKGIIYGDNVKAEFTVRSMTTDEEMKRLNPTDKPYKAMAEIIDACMVDKPGISAYDMCLGDYQFCLHKLRIVTYGSKYKLSTICPYCGTENSDTVDLSQLKVLEYSKDVEKYAEVTLPATGKKVTLMMQTPRTLDEIAAQTKESAKKSNGQKESAFLLNLTSMVDKVDGERLDFMQLQAFVRHLPMADTNMLAAYGDKLNGSIGLDTRLDNTCEVCGLDYTSNFRTTAEFFRPTIDI